MSAARLAVLGKQARLKRTQTALQDECVRRRQSEVVVSKLQARLTKFSKASTLGAMTTGIAHEINQPLIAIQDYAQGAKRRLQSSDDQTTKLHELKAEGMGMGIGLAMCRAVIEAHGGRIWYESNSAGGAIFRFTLRQAEA